MKHLRLSQAVAQALAPPGSAACPSPGRQPLRLGASQQDGFSLFETIVTFGLVALMGAGIYVAYGPGSVSSTVQAEVVSLNDLRRNVDSAYRTRGNFEGISVQTGTTDKWIPAHLVNNGTWGNFSLGAVSTHAVANDTWQASYSAVPTDACGRLIGVELNHWDTVLVNGQAVGNVTDGLAACGGRTSNTVALQLYGGRRINPDTLPPLTLSPGAPTAPTSPIYTTPITQPPVVATPPSSGTPVGPSTPAAPNTPDAPGTYGPPGTGGSSNPPAPTYTPCVAPAPAVSCHSCSDLGAYNGTYCTAVDATCSGPYGTVSYGSPRSYSYGCTPMCSAPPGITETSNQSTACPAGTLTPAGAGSFSQTRTRPVTYACPAGASTYTTNYGTYTPWTPDASTACAPKCTPPANTNQSQSQTAYCPNGQYVSGTTTNAFTQTQSRSVTYSCPSPTGAYATTYGAYGPWSPTAAQVCAPICYAPTPQQQFAQCPPGQAVPGPFPANYYGVQQQRDGYCTSSTGTPTYGGWYNTGYVACAPVCSAPAPTSTTQYQSVLVPSSCPSGYTGTYSYYSNQSLTTYYSYSCPQVTGGYNTSTSNTGWVQYSTSPATNTCKLTPTCVAVEAFVVVRRQGEEMVLRAVEVREGDELRVINPGTGAKRWGVVSVSYTETVEMVRVVTEADINLRCSKTAPIGLADGGHVVAAEALGQVIATDVLGQYGSSSVVAVDSLGLGKVQMITCENDFFLAGDVEGRYLAHHNKKNGSGCVAPDAVVVVRRQGEASALRAAEVCLGDELRLMDPTTGDVRWGEVVIAKVTQNRMVRVTTASGVELDCSIEAPLGLANGTHVLAKDVLGATLAVDLDDRYGPSEVIRVQELATTTVIHLHCDGGSFLVGNVAGRYLIHE